MSLSPQRLLDEHWNESNVKLHMYTLTQANQIQSTAKEVSDATRAQCLSKLGFCCVCEGSVSKGFEYIDIALKLRKDRAKEFNRSKDKVMTAACLDDLAGL